MSITESVRLKTSLTIPQFRSQYYLWKTQVTNDLSELSEKDPELNNAWNLAFGTAIDDAESAPKPYATITEKEHATRMRNERMDTAVDKNKDLLLIASLVHKTNKERLKNYGSESLSKVSRNPDKLLNVLLLTEQTMTEDATDLDAKGFTLAMQADFSNMCAYVRGAYTEQRRLNNLVREITNAYYTKLNIIYDMMVKVNRAAKRRYANDPAKLAEYLLNPYSDNTDLAFTILLEAIAGSDWHRFNTSLNPSQHIIIKMLDGTADCTIHFSTTEAGPIEGVALTLAQGTTATFLFSDFGGAGKYMHFTQTGPSPMRLRISLPGM